jgi:hypothetical protein
MRVRLLPDTVLFYAGLGGLGMSFHRVHYNLLLNDPSHGSVDFAA